MAAVVRDFPVGRRWVVDREDLDGRARSVLGATTAVKRKPDFFAR